MYDECITLCRRMKWLTQVQADQANRLSSTQKSENEVASASSASIERKKLETGFVKGATVLTCSHCLEHALIYVVGFLFATGDFRRQQDWFNWIDSIDACSNFRHHVIGRGKSETAQGVNSERFASQLQWAPVLILVFGEDVQWMAPTVSVALGCL